MKFAKYFLLAGLCLVVVLSSAQIGIKDPKTGKIITIGSLNPVREMQTANYSRPAEPLNKVQIAAINKPATVKIHSTFELEFSYKEPNFFSRTMLQVRTDNAAQKGEIENTPNAKFDYALEVLKNETSSYIRPTLMIMNGSMSLGSSGSGMFLTPDGYVLTNAHVVELDPNQARAIVIQDVAKKLVDDEINRYAQYFKITQVNQEKINATAAVMLQAISNFVTLGRINPSYYIETGRTIKNPNYKLPATLVVKGGSIPGKDVAILKTTIQNAPTVALGKASELEIGEDLFLLGYPGVVDNNETLSQMVMEEPTFATGSASSWQQVAGNWKALGFDGNAAKGNSGGPVFNNRGEVIGMLTFGSPDPNRIGLKQGFNFIVPTVVISEFISRAGVTPSMGNLDSVYRQGIMAYHNKNYGSAQSSFKHVQSTQRNWPYIDDYISKSASKNIAIPVVVTPESSERFSIKKLFKKLDLYGIKWYTAVIIILMLLAGIIKLFR